MLQKQLLAFGGTQFATFTTRLCLTLSDIYGKHMLRFVGDDIECPSKIVPDMFGPL